MKTTSPDNVAYSFATTLARYLRLILLGAFCVLTPGATAILQAQVQEPTVNLGDTNFEDGYAGPGVLLEEIPGAYTANEQKDANGRTTTGSNHVTAISSITHIGYVSQKKFLGAWIGSELLLPVVSLDAKLANGVDTSVHGVGDLEVGPLVLQWAPKRAGKGVFVQRALLDIAVPTGKYSSLRPVNPGNNAVSINPYYAFTYAPTKRWEISARTHYLWNATNNDPFVGLGVHSIQAGQAVHANYATSYELHKNVRVGFNGYWLQQITDHRINGVDIADSRERTIGLGPGLQIAGHGIWFRANSYMETGVQNRMSGTKVTFRISKVIGSRPPAQ